MRKRIELLAHAGAPSGRKDDDQYRAQADAYFDFMAGTIMKLSSSTPESPIAAPTKPDENAQRDDDEAVAESPTVFLDDTQLAITVLQSQLLTSSLPVASGKTADYDRDRIQNTPTEAVSSDDQQSPTPNEALVERESLLQQICSSGKRPRGEGGEDVRRDVGGRTAKAVNGEPRQRRASYDALSLSSYLKTPVLDRPVKKRRVEGSGKASFQNVLQSHATVRAGDQAGLRLSHESSHEGATEVPAPPATAPAAIQRSQGSLPASELTSELPTSYSLSDITSESSRARVGVSQRSIRTPTGAAAAVLSKNADASTVSGSSGRGDASAASRAPSIISTSHALDNPQPEVVVIEDDMQGAAGVSKVPKDPKAAASLLSDGKPSEQVLSTAPAGQGPVRQTGGTHSAPDIPQLPHSLSTSILPPEPEVSLDRFTTHITLALANLAAHPDVHDRYQPVTVTREIRPLERGYWLIDPSPWSLDRQVKFWRFLEQVIGNGSLGWGVWCTRAADSSFGVIRAYCWGEVVMHMYLLLYVASSSQVRKLGLCWVDGQEEVVVRMRKA